MKTIIKEVSRVYLKGIYGKGLIEENWSKKEENPEW